LRCAVIHDIDVDDVAVGIFVIIVVDEMGADETASTGYENTFFESGHYTNKFERCLYVLPQHIHILFRTK